MSDHTEEMQEELLSNKIDEIKDLIEQAASSYSSISLNSFIKTKPFQELIIDRFLTLDNILQNTDEWSKDEILEMSALFMLMSIDDDMIEELDDTTNEVSEPEENEDA